MPVPTPSGKNLSAGTRNHFLAFTDDDGVILGASPTRPANGTGSGMLRLWAAKRAPATVPSPDVVMAEGDDGEVLQEFSFKSIASRGFVAEIAVQDLTIAGLLANVPVRSLGRGSFVALDTQSSPLYNVCVILQGRSKDAVSGAQQWSGVIIPRAQAQYLGRQEFNERTAAVYRFFITPTPAGWSPLGYTYQDNNSVQKPTFYDEFKGYPNPITLQAFSGDGIVTAIPVDYPPVSAAGSILALTPPSGQGATAGTVSSVSSTSPYTITASAAPADGVRAALLYEWQQ